MNNKDKDIKINKIEQLEGEEDVNFFTRMLALRNMIGEEVIGVSKNGVEVSTDSLVSPYSQLLESYEKYKEEGKFAKNVEAIKKQSIVLKQEDDETVENFFTRLLESKKNGGPQKGLTSDNVEIDIDTDSKSELYQLINLENAGAVLKAVSENEQEPEENMELSEEDMELPEENITYDDTLASLTTFVMNVNGMKDYDPNEMASLSSKIETEKELFEKLQVEIKNQYAEKEKTFIKTLNLYTENKKQSLKASKELIENLNEEKESIIKDNSEWQDKHFEELKKLNESEERLIKIIESDPKYDTLYNSVKEKRGSLSSKEIVGLASTYYAAPFIEELKTYAEQTKWVEAYEEYEEFQNSEINRINSLIETEEEKSVEQEQTNDKRINYLIETYKKELHIEFKDKKLIIHPEKDQRLIDLQDSIKLAEERHEILSQTSPITVQNDIRRLMKKKADPEVVAAEIDKMLEFVGTDTLDIVYEKDSEKNDKLDEKITDVEENISKLTEKLSDENNYYSEDLRDMDKGRSSNLIEEMLERDATIKSLERKIKAKDSSEKIKELKTKIAKTEKMYKKTKKDRENYIKLNGEKENDSQLERYDDSLKFYENQLKDLTIDLDTYSDLKSNVFETKENLEMKLENARKLQDECEMQLQKQEEKLLDNTNYINVAEKNNDEIKLVEEQEKLASLQEQKSYVSQHSISDVKYQIIEDYRNNLRKEQEEADKLASIAEEEPVEFVDRKISTVLLDKIKNIKFKEKMKKFMTGAAVAAGLTTAGIASINSGVAEVDAAPAISVDKEDIDLDTAIDNNEDVEVEVQANVQQDVKVDASIDNKESEDKVVGQIDPSKIATDKYKAAAGDFVDKDKVKKDIIDDSTLMAYVNSDGTPFEYNGNQVNIQAVEHDGQIIGYTLVDQAEENNELEESGKVR